MAELMEAYSNSKAKNLARGTEVEGVVIEKTSKTLVLDIGWKSEGLVAEKAYEEARDFIKGVEIGDKVKAHVIVPETSDGFTILSLRKTSSDAIWKKLEDAYDNDKTISVRVRNTSGSGVMVETMGVSGFIPASLMGKKAMEQAQNLIGGSVQVKVIEVDRGSNRAVFSERAVSEADEVAEELMSMKAIKKGKVYTGEVTTVTDFGCFVKVFPRKNSKVGIDGLVHISELSWDKVGKTSDVVKVGDKVEVEVINIENKKLALSMKKAMDDPWTTIEKKYKADAKTKGEVVRISDFGYFVQLEPGVEGLIHMTKVPPGTKIREGDELNVYVEEVNAKERRISLGMVLASKPVGYK